MTSLPFVIAILLAIVITSTDGMPRDERFHAAKCLAMKNACTRNQQRKSGGVCRSGKYARTQSAACHARACAWCRLRGKNRYFPCSWSNVRYICGELAAGRRVLPSKKKSNIRKKPAPPRRRSPPTRPPATRPPVTKPPVTKPPASKGQCSYRGTTKVVVSLGGVKPAKGWTYTKRNGMGGMIFGRDKNHGIVNPESSTTMCFNVRTGMSGDYIVTAVSAAPHGTENNDMWISSSVGFKLLRHGKFKNGNANKFYKGYQNMGGLKFADYLSTVDHNGHAFVVPNLKAGQMIKLCISGRSFRYEVFKIIIAKCSGRMCLSGRPRAGSLVHAPPSRCM